MTSTHIENKGTGAGGANTNATGLAFEHMTEPQDFYEVVKRCQHHEEIRFFYCEKTYIYTKQWGFSKYMGEKINKTIKPVHGAKNPDEVYIDEKEKILFIVEKRIRAKSRITKNASPAIKLYTYTACLNGSKPIVKLKSKI